VVNYLTRIKPNSEVLYRWKEKGNDSQFQRIGNSKSKFNIREESAKWQHGHTNKGSGSESRAAAEDSTL
jgi:hypothetical protein